jgi:hypothetical protein
MRRSLLARVGAGFGAVGARGFAFGRTTLGFEFGLQRAGATVGLRDPLDEFAQLAANRLELRAGPLKVVAVNTSCDFGPICALVLGLHALP